MKKNLDLLLLRFLVLNYFVSRKAFFCVCIYIYPVNIIIYKIYISPAIASSTSSYSSSVLDQNWNCWRRQMMEPWEKYRTTLIV